MNFTCPVCAYNKLDFPPIDFNICPSCGTEFGYDDLQYSSVELTRRWVLNGMLWWSRDVPMPEEWNPYNQLQTLVIPNLVNVTNSIQELDLAQLTTPIYSIQVGFSFPGQIFTAKNTSNASTNHAFASIPA